jgi:hypothetical protein
LLELKEKKVCFLKNKPSTQDVKTYPAPWRHRPA